MECAIVSKVIRERPAPSKLVRRRALQTAIAKLMVHASAIGDGRVMVAVSVLLSKIMVS
jgi:hypothetical protein